MPDHLKVQRVILDDQIHFMVVDRESGTVCDDLTDYCLYLACERELNHKTVECAAFHLKRFAEYLKLHKIDLRLERDKRGRDGRVLAKAFHGLREFRDLEQQRVLKNPKGRRNERAAKRTVNIRLQFVASWLVWLKERGKISPGVVGFSSNAKVQLEESLARPRKRSESHSTATVKIRGLFRRTGLGSKHKRSFVPDQDDVIATKRSVQEQATTPFKVHRDVLIMDIADELGMRRGSIASLKVDQFTRAPDPEEDYIEVIPASQKFDYDDSIAFPVALYERVRSFCEDYLAEEAKNRSWAETTMKGQVFVSVRDGKPLEDRSITHLVRRYLRLATGAPPGASVHSLRHKYFNDDIERETIYRLKAGLDTSAMSIATAVSRRGSQKNPLSLYAYVSHYLSSAKMRRRTQKLQEAVNTPRS